MNVYKSSAQLKADAREKLIGKYGTVIAASLIVQLIAYIVAAIAGFMTDVSLAGYVIYYAVCFIMELINAVFTVGLIYLNLNISCNRDFKTSDVFYGFRTHPDKAIICKLIVFLFTLLFLAPAIVLTLLYVFLEWNAVFLPIISLLYVIGTIAAIWIHLQYSQIFYLMLDFPEYSAKELLSLSKEVMKGNMGRLFYIHVSFLPLYLLGLCSLGIGFFFIYPYRNMTLAQFYLNLIACRQKAAYSE